MARAVKPARSKASSSKAALAIDIVYVGPTLAADEVARLLPGASVRGPVAVGELLRAIDERGVKRIAIIDGYFERMAAVWHKEILLALEAGIEVWGAASMGALRAAELAPFGMRGVGTIFERFASGALVADDEVAVAHLPAEFGYRATSVALVDLRDGIHRAISHARMGVRAADRVGEREHAQLVELARAQFYRDRTWERLVADAKAAAMPPALIAALEATAKVATSATKAKHAAKADDARLLLETMATTPRTKPAKIRVPRTWALAQLRSWLDR